MCSSVIKVAIAGNGIDTLTYLVFSTINKITNIVEETHPYGDHWAFFKKTTKKRFKLYVCAQMNDYITVQHCSKNIFMDELCKL